MANECYGLEVGSLGGKAVVDHHLLNLHTYTHALVLSKSIVCRPLSAMLMRRRMRRQGLGAVALVLCDLRLVLREPCVDGVVTLYVKGGSCVGCCLVLGAVLGEGL